MPEFAQGNDLSRTSDPFQGLSVLSNPVLSAWGEAGTSYLKACAAWQQEMSRFLGTRVEADVTAQKSLASCRSLADAAKLQQEWAATTVNDYFNEIGRLVEIVSSCVPCGQVAASTPAATVKEGPQRTKVAS